MNNFNKYRKNYLSLVLKGKKVKPKKLIFGIKTWGGKNNHGKVVIFTKGKNKKKIYKYFDYKRSSLHF